MSPAAERETGRVIQPDSDLYVAGIIFALAIFSVGMWAGKWIESSKPKPAPEVVYRAPLTQWQCTKQEGREYVHACRHRLLSDAVGAR